MTAQDFGSVSTCSPGIRQSSARFVCGALLINGNISPPISKPLSRLCFLANFSVWFLLPFLSLVLFPFQGPSDSPSSSPAAPSRSPMAGHFRLAHKLLADLNHTVRMQTTLKLRVLHSWKAFGRSDPDLIFAYCTLWIDGERGHISSCSPYNGNSDFSSKVYHLGHRNSTQRKEIREAFQQQHGESLIDLLDSELSGDFGKAKVLWTHDPAERDAILANEALRGRKHGVKQLQVIVKIACTNSPHHLQSVNQAYCARFDCCLEEHIGSAVVSPPLRKLLVGLVSSYRYAKEVVNMDSAHLESAKLYEAVEIKELDHDDIVYILATRNVYQLKDTFQLYEQRFWEPNS